jgi:hypothetical protein
MTFTRATTSFETKAQRRQENTAYMDDEMPLARRISVHTGRVFLPAFTAFGLWPQGGL